MPRTAPAALLIALALAATGCGTAQESGADRFSGEEGRVAQVVEDLASAGTEKDAEEICSRILAKPLVDRLSAGGQDCAAEVTKAVDDADEFELEVVRVQVTGTTAVARVKDGTGRSSVMRFVREGQDWRASSLS